MTKILHYQIGELGFTVETLPDGDPRQALQRHFEERPEILDAIGAETGRKPTIEEVMEHAKLTQEETVPDWNDFEKKYKLVPNHFKDAHPFMFETFGNELEFVLNALKRRPKRVWTLVDGDNGTSWITAGYHLVNRVGYFVTLSDWEREDEQYLYD